MKQKGRREKIGWGRLVVIDIAAAVVMIAGLLSLLRLMMRRFYERNVPIEQRKLEEAKAEMWGD